MDIGKANGGDELKPSPPLRCSSRFLSARFWSVPQVVSPAAG